MNDLISRQAAIQAIKEHRALYCDNTPDTFSRLSYAEKSRVDELDTAIATLVNLPPAQKEQSAEWVPSTKYKGFLTCSACEDCYIEGWSDKERKWQFCPSCGARLIYEGHKN